MTDENNRASAREKKKITFKSLLKDFWPFLTIVLVCVFLFKVVLLHGYVPTGSMIPTVLPGDGIIAARLAYASAPVERFDIVVFKSPEDDKILVKRIIGLPGDEVRIDAEADLVYVNGKPLEDPYLNEPPVYAQDITYKVPESSYFMMGDNRNNSADSRAWEYPYLDEKRIIGRVIMRYSLWGENGFYFIGVKRGV